MAEKKEMDTFDWLKLKSDIGSVEIKRETAWEKFTRKCSENPFVPIGAAATLGCLIVGLDSFRRGENRRSQIMMRARVLAQGFTVASLAIGITYTAYKRSLESPPLPPSPNSVD